MDPSRSVRRVAVDVIFYAEDSTRSALIYNYVAFPLDSIGLHLVGWHPASNGCDLLKCYVHNNTREVLLDNNALSY